MTARTEAPTPPCDRDATLADARAAARAGTAIEAPIGVRYTDAAR